GQALSAKFFLDLHPPNQALVPGVLVFFAKKSGHADHLTLIERAQNEAVADAIWYQAFFYRVNCCGLMLPHRVNKGMWLLLESFESQMPVRLGIFFRESTNFHGAGQGR